jgi:hypothetical protein
MEAKIWQAQPTKPNHVFDDELRAPPRAPLKIVSPLDTLMFLSSALPSCNLCSIPPKLLVPGCTDAV